MNIQGERHHFLEHVIDGSRFYFLNSYYVPAETTAAVMVAEHTASFAAAVSEGSLFATQFHPEKSSADGVSLLKEFLVATGARSAD